MREQAEKDLELGDYLALFKRRWAWVVVPALLFPAVAFYLSTAQNQSFTASAEVLINDSAAQDAIGGGSQNTSFRNRVLENEIRLSRSDEATETVADRLGIDIGKVPDFTVTADEDSDVLIFTATRSSAEGSATLANVAAETYVELKQRQATDSINGAVANLRARLMELQDAREATRADLITLEDTLAGADEEDRPAAQILVDRENSRISGQISLIDAQISATANSITDLELSGELALGGTARIIAAAIPPLESNNTPLSRNLVLGLAIGLTFGAALALLRDNLDDKMRTTEDFERFGIVPLGSIPRAPRKTNEALELATISLTGSDTAQAQGHQKTQAAVRFLASQLEVNNVLITSASQGEGKTTLASNLAISMALANVRTVLVDVDFRRPRVHKAYGLSQSPGLSTVVVDDVDVVSAATIIPDSDDHLAVVTAGKLPPHPASFISSYGFGEAVKQLSKLSDFTIYDAPPVLPVADTLTLSQMVDGVIVVAYANVTKREDFKTAIESLRNSGARILGGVLLGAATEASAYEYADASGDLEHM